jgi:BirA family biotin operon repressor/biotin-[acetyl-CoA-carboxylase] ligase
LSSKAPDWPAGVDRRDHDTLDSTSAEAARIAPALAGPTWVSARRQSAARGRRGRAWTHPEGNFAATLVMPMPGDPGTAALRSFTAALALDEALQALGVPATRLALKWPNDVLLDGGKLAGILLETLGQGGAHHLAIGIGVNLAAAPPAEAVEQGAVPPVALSSVVPAPAPEVLLAHLAPALAGWERVLTHQGFAPVRRAWLDRAARLGEAITARTPRNDHHGTFRTIDADGALILGTARGDVTLAAADIHF